MEHQTGEGLFLVCRGDHFGTDDRDVTCMTSRRDGMLSQFANFLIEKHGWEERRAVTHIRERFQAMRACKTRPRQPSRSNGEPWSLFWQTQTARTSSRQKGMCANEVFQKLYIERYSQKAMYNDLRPFFNQANAASIETDKDREAWELAEMVFGHGLSDGELQSLRMHVQANGGEFPNPMVSLTFDVLPSESRRIPHGCQYAMGFGKAFPNIRRARPRFAENGSFQHFPEHTAVTVGKVTVFATCLAECEYANDVKDMVLTRSETFNPNFRLRLEDEFSVPGGIFVAKGFVKEIPIKIPRLLSWEELEPLFGLSEEKFNTFKDALATKDPSTDTAARFLTCLKGTGSGTCKEIGQQAYKFNPGKMGIDYDEEGITKKVKRGSPADVMGIKPGAKIVKFALDGAVEQTYSQVALANAETSTSVYTVTFLVRQGHFCDVCRWTEQYDKFKEILLRAQASAQLRIVEEWLAKMRYALGHRHRYIQWCRSSLLLAQVPRVEISDLEGVGGWADAQYHRKEPWLGAGSFADVFRSTWFGQQVAIKRFHSRTLTAEAQAQIQNEAQLHFSLRHTNIVSLLGICEERPGDPPSLVMEHMDGGSLAAWLRATGGPVAPREQIQVLLQIANGLHYLHRQMPRPVLHRDLRPSNVLVNLSQRCAKLADFGISKMALPHETSHQTLPGGSRNAWPWLAPELLRSDGPLETFSRSADIYAFGILMWQILSRSTQEPWHRLGSGEQARDRGIRAVVHHKRRPCVCPVCDGGWDQASHAGGQETLPVIAQRQRNPWLGDLLQQCWHDSLERRPEASVIVNELMTNNLQTQDLFSSPRNSKVEDTLSVASSSRQEAALTSVIGSNSAAAVAGTSATSPLLPALQTEFDRQVRRRIPGRASGGDSTVSPQAPVAEAMDEEEMDGDLQLAISMSMEQTVTTDADAVSEGNRLVTRVGPDTSGSTFSVEGDVGNRRSRSRSRRREPTDRGSQRSQTEAITVVSTGRDRRSPRSRRRERADAASQRSQLEATTVDSTGHQSPHVQDGVEADAQIPSTGSPEPSILSEEREHRGAGGGDMHVHGGDMHGRVGLRYSHEDRILVQFAVEACVAKLMEAADFTRANGPTTAFKQLIQEACRLNEDERNAIEKASANFNISNVSKSKHTLDILIAKMTFTKIVAAFLNHKGYAESTRQRYMKAFERAYDVEPIGANLSELANDNRLASVSKTDREDWKILKSPWLDFLTKLEANNVDENLLRQPRALHQLLDGRIHARIKAASERARNPARIELSELSAATERESLMNSFREWVSKKVIDVGTPIRYTRFLRGELNERASPDDMARESYVRQRASLDRHQKAALSHFANFWATSTAASRRWQSYVERHEAMVDKFLIFMQRQHSLEVGEESMTHTLTSYQNCIRILIGLPSKRPSAWSSDKSARALATPGSLDDTPNIHHNYKVARTKFQEYYNSSSFSRNE